MGETLAINGGPKAVTESEELRKATSPIRIGDEEKSAVVEALGRPNVYSVTDEFEREFAEYHAAKFALAQCNGTSTLHAAYFAVGVEPGDEVICPAYTWHLAVSPILALHAIPVFCDIDPLTMSISSDDIRRKISPRTKAICMLHPYGAVAPMDEIMAVAEEHSLPVIEDASHAHGAAYKDRKVGTIGHIGCFSLQASKILSAVEGGVLVTNNEDYYSRAVVLGHYERIGKLGSERYTKYTSRQPGSPTCFGFKYRMHPAAAAMARVQLRTLDERNAVRRRSADYLSQAIRRTTDALVPPVELPGTKRTYLNYIAQYFADKMNGVSRDRFVEALNAEGLPATAGRTGYLPVYWNPLYEERSMWAEGCPFDCCHTSHKVIYSKGDCPEAEALWQRTVGLPVFVNPCPDALLDQCIRAISKVTMSRDQLSNVTSPA